MSETAPAPKATFAVEMGPDDPRIRIQIGERSIPIDIQPQQAAELGLALLGASALCSPGHPRPTEGEAIGSTYMPVVKWQAAHLEDAKLPVLVAALLGGAHIFLRFTPQQAAACSAGLGTVAANLQSPPDK